MASTNDHEYNVLHVTHRVEVIRMKLMAMSSNLHSEKCHNILNNGIEMGGTRST
jgi:hypothetical protein